MNKRKNIIIIVLALFTIGLVGCGSALLQFANTTLPNEIAFRGEANKKLAKQFSEIGVFSKDDLEKINANIDEQVKKYNDMNFKSNDNVEVDTDESTQGETTTTETDGDSTTTTTTNTTSTTNTHTDNDYSVTNSSVLSQIANSVSQYTLGGNGTPSYVQEVDSNGSSKNIDANGDAASYKNYIISNYLHFEFFGNSSGTAGETISEETTNGQKRLRPVLKDDGTIESPRGDAIEPLRFVGETYTKKINSMTKIQLYVLKSDITTGSDISTVDGLMSKVQDAVKQTSAEKRASTLDNYFVRAEDTNGNPITLINLEDKDFNIVDISKVNDGTHNEPGYDMVIGQYDMNDCIHVCALEFNQEALNKLQVLGLETSRIFLVQDKGSTWRGYLMEYPVHTLNKFKDNGDDTVTASLSGSGLGVNIMTGKFLKYEWDSTSKKWDYTKTTEIDSKSYYLTLNPSQNEDETGVTSLVLKGYASNYIIDTSGKERKFMTGRIVLRDYLEATYAPEYVKDENLVVFGRKIRMNMSDDKWKADGEIKVHDPGTDTDITAKNFKLIYQKGTDIAEFVDYNGKTVAETPYLQITDFCDASYLKNNNKDYKKSKVVTITQKGMKQEKRKATFQKDTLPTTSELQHITIGKKGQKIKTNGKKKTVKTIKSTIMFPSSSIGSIDYASDTSSKQRFYCLTTKQGIFDSALFSSWINSESTTASVDWWNEYLAENKYDYKVGHTELNDYLTGNYKYELSQSGVIILDLDVVSKIQEQYDEEADDTRVEKIRTIFILIGWIMIIYSMMLMLLWIIDTNLDVGMGLLSKVTFGHWVAVKYEDEVPGNRLGEQTYLTGGKLFIRCLIIIAVGIIVISINIFDIVVVLIDTFGNIASTLEKLISGIK